MDRLDREFPLSGEEFPLSGSPPPAQSENPQTTNSDLNNMESSVELLARAISRSKSPLSNMFHTDSSPVKAHSVTVKTECY
jgi:hypothetical protein